MASMIETRRVPVRRLSAVAAGVVLLAGLGGCGEGDQAAEAVRVSAMEIETLSLGGANPAPLGQEDRLAAFEKIVQRLRPHTSGGEAGGTRSAANLVMARAQAALAGMQTEKLAEAHRKTLAGITSVRGMLDRYLSEQTAAAAQEQYDPGPQLADLDKQIRSRDEEIARVVQEKRALEKELADLDAQAAAESEKSRAARLEETKLRQQAVNLRAVEQAELIEQAAQHKRTADAHDMQASLLRAQITQREPGVAEYAVLIDRLTEQRRLLDEAKVEVQAFAKATAGRAASARASAMQAAEQIKAALTELDGVRGPVQGIADGIVKGYEDAAAACSKAGNIGEARLGAASNDHAKADVLAMWAQGEKAYAKLLRDLADATPELPGIADLRKRADGAEEKAIGLVDRAKEALEEAKNAYTEAGGRGEAEERLQKLDAKLQTLIEARSDPSKLAEEAAPVAATSSSAAQPEPAAAGGGEEGEIRAMLEQLAAMEGGKFADAKRYLHASTPSAQEFMAFAEKVAPASEDLTAAMEEKFGADLGELPGVGGAVPDFDFSDVQISVLSPTAATLMMKGQGAGEMPLGVVKVDGAWKLDMDSLATAMGPMLKPMMRMADPMAAALRQIASDVRAGTYSTKEEVQQALMNQLGTLMMQQGGGG